MPAVDLKSRIVSEILSNEDVVVKSQQIDDPEMTLEEKRTYLLDFIEEKKPSVVLSKFAKFLHHPEYLGYFRSRTNGDPDEEYCVDYHMQQLQKTITPKASTIRNRRFGALQSFLNKKDDYFSEQEMMKREPGLYEQLVGRYMTEQEKQMRDRCENPTFLSALLKGIEMEHLREHTERAIAAPSNDSDAEDSGDEEQSPSSSLWGEFDDAPKKPVARNRSPQKRVSDAEKEEMKREFIEAMYQKFLCGEDKEYDYTSVDNNAEYDDLEMETQDEQDKYFDESDEEDKKD